MRRSSLMLARKVWASSLTTVGEMNTINSSRSLLLVEYLNRCPRYGIRSRYGIPLFVSLMVSLINPPNTTVAPDGTVTVVVKRWLFTSGTWFPEIVTVLPRVSLICATLRVTSLPELIKGITSSLNSTSS